MSPVNPTPASESDFDLKDEQKILHEFLDTIDSDDNDNDVSSVHIHSVCSNCKHPNKEGKDLIWCSCCQKLATSAFRARKRVKKIGRTFIDSLVRLWASVQTL